MVKRDKIEKKKWMNVALIILLFGTLVHWPFSTSKMKFYENQVNVFYLWPYVTFYFCGPLIRKSFTYLRLLQLFKGSPDNFRQHSLVERHSLNRVFVALELIFGLRRRSRHNFVSVIKNDSGLRRNQQVRANSVERHKAEIRVTWKGEKKVWVNSTVGSDQN